MVIPLIFHLEEPSQLVNKPILLTNFGQSLMVGLYSETSWLNLNHPEALGVQNNIFITYSIYSGTPTIETLNVGTNQNFGYPTNFGPSVSMAIKLKEYTKQPIHLAYWGLGGTQLYWDGISTTKTWNINQAGAYYDNICLCTDQMISYMNNLYGVGNWVHLAMCFQQGEADNDLGVKTAAYADNEKDLILNYRGKYGDDIIFLSGLTHYNNGITDVNSKKIYNQTRISKYYSIPNNDLTTTDASTHLDAPSQWQNGLRYFDILKQFVKQN